MLTSQVYCRPDFVPFPWQVSHLMLRASDNFLHTTKPQGHQRQLLACRSNANPLMQPLYYYN